MTTKTHTKTMWRLVQISDCHLLADTSLQYRKHQPAQCLQQLVPALLDVEADLIVVSGDISEDASADSYLNFQQLLTPLNCPVLVLPGNHDCLEKLTAVGTMNWQQTPVGLGPWEIIALNSRIEGRAEGRLSQQELDRLARLPEQRPCIVFCHHHPLPIGTPWIDRFPLTNGSDLLQKITSQAQIKALAFGHIHQAWESRSTQLHLLGCPASSVNTQAGVHHFTDDQLGPAARQIDLFADGTLTTSIIRRSI